MSRFHSRNLRHGAAAIVAALLAVGMALLGGCASQPVRPGIAAAQAPDTVTAAAGDWESGSAAETSGVAGDAGSAVRSGPGASAAGTGPAAAGKSAPGDPAAAGKVAAGAGKAGSVPGVPGPDSAGTAARGAADSSMRVGPAPSPAPPRTEPLIMENADRMEGFRSRGEYVLTGKVRFTHGALRLETDRAVWLKDQSLVYAESGMRIVHRGSVLTADRGSYDKNQGRATAEGRVRMRDSSGEVEAEGNAVVYLRFRHEATLTGNPVVRRFYRKPPDSAAAGAPARKPSGDTSAGLVIDTLAIRGRVLTYNDSAQVATADGDVVITRKQMNITCKRAEYRDRTDSLYLSGDPAVKVDESRVTGLTMRVGMDGEEIKSLLVKGEAKAKSVEPATDTSAARESDISGDSLFMAFRDKSIDSVQVFRNAKGSYFEKDKPGYVNRMSGEYMVLRFLEKKINSANVLGGAKSTYFHVERKTFKGRNEAEGDTIDFAFKDGKVDEVLVRGNASGTYFGSPPKGRGPVDSVSAPGDGRVPADTASPGAAPAKDAAPGPKPPDGEGAGKAAAPAGGRPPAGAQNGAPPPPPAGERDGQHGPNNPWRRK